LVKSNYTFLDIIAHDEKSKIRGQAQALLEEAKLDSFSFEIFLPSNNKSLKTDKHINDYEPFDNNNFDDCFNIYPNPVKNKLFIEYILFNNPSNSIKVFDLNGKLLFSKTINMSFGIERINVSSLSPGTYIVKLGEFKKKFSIVQ